MLGSSFTMLPPPTSNFLDIEDRARLVKSTRKITEVLGTVPRLLDEQSPRSSQDSGYASGETPRAASSLGFTPSTHSSRTRASNRTARVLTQHVNGSRSSFISFEDFSDPEDSSDDDELSSPEPDKPSLVLPPRTSSKWSARKQKPIGPSLYLNINANPSSVLNIAAGRPSVSYDDLRTAVPPSPLLTPGLLPAVDRRRQMAAKLTRHLGESVPPELIVSGRPRGRSHSHEETRSVFGSQQEALLYQVHSRQSDYSIAVAPVAVAPQHQRQYQHQRHASEQEQLSPRRHESKIYEVVNVHIPPSVVAAASSNSFDRDRLGQLPQGMPHRKPAGGRKTGKEWSGEWNHDIEDVMSKLRGLK